VQSDEVLERNGRRQAEDEASWVYGVAYEIPPEIRDEGRQQFIKLATHCVVEEPRGRPVTCVGWRN
jgi:hypothetical protein